jgi:hypothetical protein
MKKRSIGVIARFRVAVAVDLSFSFHSFFKFSFPFLSLTLTLCLTFYTQLAANERRLCPLSHWLTGSSEFYIER